MSKNRRDERVGYHDDLLAVGWQVRVLGHLVAHYRGEDVTMSMAVGRKRDSYTDVLQLAL